MLGWVASSGHEALVSFLLGKNNVDLNDQDYNGQTPLSVAVKYVHEEVICLLLANDNVDPNIRNKDPNV